MGGGGGINASDKLEGNCKRAKISIFLKKVKHDF